MDHTNKQQSEDKVPPVPLRPEEQQLAAPRYNPYGSPMAFGGPSIYGMGPMSGLAGLGSSHMPFGMHMMSNANPPIDGTFQSIQSIVQAFSSISMMLESTYMAVHSSFRAVMDVADHFVRLKDHLAGIMSVVSIYNTIKWFFRRILYMFNLVNEDQIWSDSLASASEALRKGQQSIMEHGQSQTSWPMLMFLGVALGAPIMIYNLNKPPKTSSRWVTQEDSHYIGEVLYDFKTDHDTELPLKAGQKVIIAPKDQQPKVADWLLATTDGKRIGLIPMNYVKIVKFEIVE